MLAASPQYKTFHELCGLRRVKAGASALNQQAAWGYALLFLAMHSLFSTPSFDRWTRMTKGCSLFRNLGVGAPRLAEPSDDERPSKKRKTYACTEGVLRTFVALLDKYNMINDSPRHRVSLSSFGCCCWLHLDLTWSAAVDQIKQVMIDLAAYINETEDKNYQLKGDVAAVKARVGKALTVLLGVTDIKSFGEAVDVSEIADFYDTAPAQQE